MSSRSLLLLHKSNNNTKIGERKWRENWMSSINRFKSHKMKRIGTKRCQNDFFLSFFSDTFFYFVLHTYMKGSHFLKIFQIKRKEKKGCHVLLCFKFFFFPVFEWDIRWYFGIGDKNTTKWTHTFFLSKSIQLIEKEQD